MKFFPAILIIALGYRAHSQNVRDYPYKPVPFTAVHFNDHFWAGRLETNRKVTIPFDFKKSEETGRISNFEKAGGLKAGPFQGIRFDDSDVYKIMEGAAYSLSSHPDPALEKYMDDLIDKIAAAQEEDGYLYTNRTINPAHPAPNAGEKRWSYLNQSHELYNAGHMYEAAVAYYKATGKRKFLDVALKNADLMVRTFGPGKQYGFPGHQEIEIGLVKLYRVTGNKDYLNLAKYFLDIRGKEVENVKYPQKHDIYIQSHKPVVEQEEAVGHAVRATYMYSGMADVAALTGDTAYIHAIKKIWNNVVSKKLYLTGGIGARREGEAFGDNYELPNATAYNETCAAIGNMLWNHRMFLLEGDSKYMDVFERTLYNGFLAGVSLEGNEFFYPNPLEFDGITKFNQGRACRKPWFSCSCCPSNVVRFMPSLPGYVYATKGADIYVNLFIGNEAEINTPGNKVKISMVTGYPWEGKVKIQLTPVKPEQFSLQIRIPRWALGQPLPSDLYTYIQQNSTAPVITVNGKRVPVETKNGFAVINRKWKKNDYVTVEFPMPPHLVKANEKVEEDINKLAVERGPIVYCAEWVDNNGLVSNLILPQNTVLTTSEAPRLFDGVTLIEGEVPAVVIEDGGLRVETKTRKMTLIPYYAWAHRGIGEMSVWLPDKVKKVRLMSR